MTEEPSEKQYKYGRTEPGGIPAMRIAVLIGLPVAVLVGIGVRMFSGNAYGHIDNVLVGVIIGACLAPFTILLAWVLCVDRTTIPGAISNAENSIEGAWYSHAATDAFHVVIAGAGLGAAVASLWLPSAVSWTLIAVFAVATAAFAASYYIRKYREGR
ncbi:MAG: hypothetical protein LKF99_03980 [Bifidobacterium sp.]|nr:hypothetical protein [Bifidobacterium sp.]